MQPTRAAFTLYCAIHHSELNYINPNLINPLIRDANPFCTRLQGDVFLHCKVYTSLPSYSSKSHTTDLAVDDGRQGEVVEDLGAVPPHCNRAVLS